MKVPADVRCLVCQLIFCCGDCRWRHEELAHGLTYDCPICRGYQFLCKPEELNQDFIIHLHEEHTPLQCKKCKKKFQTMQDFTDIDKCNSISELLSKGPEAKPKEVDEKFDSLYEKVANIDGENTEDIISAHKTTRTAVITPIVRKKHLVDYECSDSEDESKKKVQSTPYPTFGFSKTPKLTDKRQRAATPHTKKLLQLKWQNAVEESDEGCENFGNSMAKETTPSRNEDDSISDQKKELTTPTSHIPHLMKLVQTVTTSTPTHPAISAWSFTEQGNDSPLSEIENTESPGQSINIEPSKTELDAIPPKLKSIIVTSSSRLRLGSQDSSEKHVTFQDSNNEVSSIKAKKVKFAEDTVFEQQPKGKRVFRKPKRMLTPGPQKPKYNFNPRFQALINRFENQGIIMARTPVNRDKQSNQENTPPVGEPSNMPARAINFRDDSPVIESDSKESNELFRTCIDSPDVVGNAITSLTANIAGSMQNCLTSVLQNTAEETEIQFKFVITKRKVCVKRIVENNEGVDEKSDDIDRNKDLNKENIWSSVARAVRNVFWGEQEANCESTTPHRSQESLNSTSSSVKRKCEELSDTESPLNYKRQKYEGRIRGRPPLRRSKTCVASLRSTVSADHKPLIRELDSMNQEDNMNLSF